jgi:hypothetical protein
MLVQARSGYYMLFHIMSVKFSYVMFNQVRSGYLRLCEDISSYVMIDRSSQFILLLQVS